MKKILHVTSSVTRNSGVMSVIMNYYRNIDNTKIQFDFLAFKKSNYSFEEEINDLGGKVFLAPNPYYITSFLKYINNFFRNNNNYIAVHLHTAYLNIIIFPIAKKNGINNAIFHAHTTKYSDKKLNGFRNRILSYSLKYTATHNIACSQEVGEFWFSNRHDFLIFPNAIDLDKYKYSLNLRNKWRNKLNVDESLVVGHVGRFNQPKNHDFLIDIFINLKKEVENAKLILIGEGPLKKEIQNKVVENKLDNDVLFLGIRDDIHEVLQASDIFVLPSLYEGLPVIGVEAQSLGIPCVVSNNVSNELAITEIVKFVDLKDPLSEWTKQMLIMKESPLEERHNVNKLVSNKGYSIEKAAKVLERFYFEMK